MTKEIVFFWFGDKKPSYTIWNIENFKKMNPSWEVNFIQYSTSDILDYKKTKDLLLEQSVELFNNKYYEKTDKFDIVPLIEHNKNCGNVPSMSQLVDAYKYLYIKNSKSDIVINFDLDCFPINNLDNFFVEHSAISNNFFIYDSDIHIPAYCYITGKTITGNKIKKQRSDMWFSYKSEKYDFIFQSCQLIQNDINFMNKKAYYNNQILINDNEVYRNILDNRIKKFKQCQLDIFDMPFCNKELSPVEHFRMQERLNLYENQILERIK